MTNPDTARPDATSDDSEYSLSIDEVADRYAHAGHPRTQRTIQRYCARADLDCRKIETAIGSRYLVAPYSVARHIAQIEELMNATSRDAPRLVAGPVVPRSGEVDATKAAPSADGKSQMSSPVVPADRETTSATGTSDSPDLSRSDATVSRYVSVLERDNDFLRGQIEVKDTQIKELTTRAKETNQLIAGLQWMLTPLLGVDYPAPKEAAPNGRERVSFFDADRTEDKQEGDKPEPA